MNFDFWEIRVWVYHKSKWLDFKFLLWPLRNQKLIDVNDIHMRSLSVPVKKNFCLVMFLFLCFFFCRLKTTLLARKRMSFWWMDLEDSPKSITHIGQNKALLCAGMGEVYQFPSDCFSKKKNTKKNVKRIHACVLLGLSLLNVIRKNP